MPLGPDNMLTMAMLSPPIPSGEPRTVSGAQALWVRELDTVHYLDEHGILRSEPAPMADRNLYEVTGKLKDLVPKDRLNPDGVLVPRIAAVNDKGFIAVTAFGEKPADYVEPPFLMPGQTRNPGGVRFWHPTRGEWFRLRAADLTVDLDGDFAAYKEGVSAQLDRIGADVPVMDDEALRGYVASAFGRMGSEVLVKAEQGPRRTIGGSSPYRGPAVGGPALPASMSGTAVVRRSGPTAR